MAEVRKTILVLGGTGIIGQHVSSVAADKGMSVYCVSRRQKTNLDDRIQQIVGDVYKKEDFENKIKGMEFDAIIDLLSFNSHQLKTSLSLFEGKCTQYVFVSSATIFGEEAADKKITESTARVSGGWNYPLSKIDCESTLRMTCNKSGQGFTIVRPYITYSNQRIAFGAWEGYGVLERIVQGRPVVIGDELAKTKTTLTHSYDLAQGVVGLIGNPQAINEDFNITSDEAVTWHEVFKTAADIVGANLTIESMSTNRILARFPGLSGKIGDRMLTRDFDNAKLKRIHPGFSCKYSVRDGYSEVINHLISEGSHPVDYMTQGRIDNLIIKSTNSETTRKAIRDYRKSPRLSSYKSFIKHSIGYYQMLFSIAARTKRIITRTHHDNYSVQK